MSLPPTVRTGEDLSVYSDELRTEPSDLYSGGRALPALIRPHARKIAGIPLLADEPCTCIAGLVSGLSVGLKM